MISRRTRRLAVAAIVIVSLMAVAFPVLAEAACTDSCSALPGMSGSSMPGMSSHAGMTGMTGMTGTVTMVAPFGSVLQAAEMACTMVPAIRAGGDGLLPSVSFSSLLLLAAVLAIALIGGLVYDRTPGRAVAALTRILSPPGHALGVRLTI